MTTVFQILQCSLKYVFNSVTHKIAKINIQSKMFCFTVKVIKRKEHLKCVWNVHCMVTNHMKFKLLSNSNDQLIDQPTIGNRLTDRPTNQLTD